MPDKIYPLKKPTDVTRTRAKGRPMLYRIDKNPLDRVIDSLGEEQVLRLVLNALAPSHPQTIGI